MTTYIIRRLLLMIPTLFGITFITYVIIRCAPGTPTAMKGDLEKGPQRQTLTSADQGDYKKMLHLDKTPVVAYFYWLRDFFGFSKTEQTQNISSKFKAPVFEVILQRLPNTMILNIWAIIISYLIGLPLGIDSAVNSRSVRERIITVALFLLYSLPVFWVGLVLVVAFGRGGYLVGWLPEGILIFKAVFAAVVLLFLAKWLLNAAAGERGRAEQTDAGSTRRCHAIEAVAWTGAILLIFGALGLFVIQIGNGLSFSQLGSMIFTGVLPPSMTPRDAGLPIAGLEPENAARLHYVVLLKASIAYYIMPVFCLTYGGLAGESRYLRVGLMEIMRQDYIRTARAKGLKGWQVIMRHAIPNALTPVIVNIAGIFPALIGGAVIVETIFGIPGMGSLMFEAVQSRDYNLVMAETFVGAILVLFGTLISDLLLPALDPRVTFEAKDA